LDKAVADGVDVINLSIGANVYEFPDMLATALMQVARAGVFVAAAAGNDGPDHGSVENAAPWITTVAASSHNRAFRATVVLSRSTPGGKLLTLVGSGCYNGSIIVTPVILAEQGAVANANMARAVQCYSGTLDAAKVRGRAVVSKPEGQLLR
jgi:subtilisin family serine protease